MTPGELRAALVTLGWSGRHLATVLGVPTDRVHSWMANRYSMPEVIGAWIARRAAGHEVVMRDDPPPRLPSSRRRDDREATL